MSISDFYRLLEQHDWYYCWSDDSRVYRAGEAADKKLMAIVKAGGEQYEALFKAYSAHMCSGAPWGTEKLPKPEMPT